MGRNNSEFEILALEVATDATRTSGMIMNPHNKGIILVVETSNEITTPTITPALQIKLGSGWHSCWVAAAAIAADDTKIYWLAPDAVAGGVYTETVAIVIPISYRVVLTYGGTGSFDTQVRAFSLV